MDFIKINKVENLVQVYQSSLLKGLKSATKYDLIIANILLAPLLEMGDQVIDKININGLIVLSGFLEEQRISIEKKYEKLGCKKIKEFKYLCL